MPTNSRPEFVQQTIGALAAQTYAALHEVVVVDDSPANWKLTECARQKLEQTIRPVQLIYVEMCSRCTIGSKRNAAVSRASGAIIGHLDDDDYSGTGRIALQAAPIASGLVDATVLPHRAAYRMGDNELLFSFLPGGFGPMWGTMFFRRSLWGSVRFANTSLGEDMKFVQDLMAAGAHVLQLETPMQAGDPSFVSVRHGSNSWAWHRSLKEKLREASHLDARGFLGEEYWAFAEHIRPRLAAIKKRRMLSPAPRRHEPRQLDKRWVMRNLLRAPRRQGEGRHTPRIEGRE